MANSQNFPSIKPSSRTFTPGRYPQTEFIAQNGAKTVIRYGDKQVDAKLTLNFTNISDSQAFAILENYRQVNSIYDYVTFNQNSGLAGIGGDGHTMPDGSLGNLESRYFKISLLALPGVLVTNAIANFYIGTRRRYFKKN